MDGERNCRNCIHYVTTEFHTYYGGDEPIRSCEIWNCRYEQIKESKDVDGRESESRR
jgi:hypothetical protein